MPRSLARTPPRALLAAGLAAACAAAGVQVSGVLARVERASVVERYQLRPAHAPKDVAIVAIDDASLSELRKRWPLSRALHARVVDRLRAAGAREIVYDVQFTEPTTPRADLALYDAVGRAGGAVLATTQTDGRGHTDVLGGDENLASVHAAAAGSVLPVERGGVMDRVPYDMAGLRTIAVVATERATGRAVARGRIPAGGARIDFRGEPGTIPSYGFADVLRGRVPAAKLRGRIVVVGATAPSLQDVHATPVSDEELMSGPEVQANAIWTVLHGFPLRDVSALLAAVLAALLALLVPLLRLVLRPLRAMLTALALVAGYVGVAYALFVNGTVLPVAGPVAGALLGTLAAALASAITARSWRLRITSRNQELEALVRERTAELEDTHLETVRRLAQAAESRDNETGRHVERIGELCHALAIAAGMAPRDADLLRHASLLHDVGKIGIPDRVLLKPGRFSPEERAVMETHTTIGAQILGGSRSPLLRLAENIALTHHERWDGTGYPAGLAGEDIPLPGRICAVCDVFDALVSRRPYKDPWTVDDALAEIQAQRGRQFDPDLVDAFLRIAPELVVEPPAGTPRLRAA